ncbi:hypothetical protein OH77DRAFT_811132 [Trametes cingulata]|nr:hypothetical protein OH77DRAFT_811132 [Trametes cingulata]
MLAQQSELAQPTDDVCSSIVAAIDDGAATPLHVAGSMPLVSQPQGNELVAPAAASNDAMQGPRAVLHALDTSARSTSTSTGAAEVVTLQADRDGGRADPGLREAHRDGETSLDVAIVDSDTPFDTVQPSVPSWSDIGGAGAVGPSMSKKRPADDERMDDEAEGAHVLTRRRTSARLARPA